MKRDMITVKTQDGITLKVPAHIVASTFIAAALAQVGAIQPVTTISAEVKPTGAPALGEYWQGQGGHNGGFVDARDGVPAHYLIIATSDVGEHEWGGRGKESAAVSKSDGMANTEALLAEGGHPAAIACDKVSADGHSDFYLPAASELYQGWLNAPELFANGCWYWSSSQRSAYGAFTMYFDDGHQSIIDEVTELRVRPVRRFFI